MTSILHSTPHPVQITLESSMPHNVVGALTRSFPEVGDALERSRVCIIQTTYWPRNPSHRDAHWRRVVHAVQKQVFCTFDKRTIPHTITP